MKVNPLTAIFLLTTMPALAQPAWEISTNWRCLSQNSSVCTLGTADCQRTGGGGDVTTYLNFRRNTMRWSSSDNRAGDAAITERAYSDALKISRFSSSGQRIHSLGIGGSRETPTYYLTTLEIFGLANVVLFDRCIPVAE